MSKCGKYWQKLEDIELDIKDVQRQLADVNRHLLSKPINPQPYLKHKQALEEKAKLLARKKDTAYSAAVGCEAKDQLNESKKEKQQG